MVATICRKFQFNAAHRLHHPLWTDEKNREVFGKCNNANYHGHNYTLVVQVTGKVDADTGYVLDTKLLKNMVEMLVIEKLDHKNLNLDVTEFAKLNPTAEHIAYVIYNLLRPRIKNTQKLEITLYETERNWVKFNGE